MTMDTLSAQEKANQYLVGGVNSPVRSFQNVGRAPLFFARASGAYIEDTQQNRYIDYVGSWGPMILGHAHPQVIHATTTAAQNGLSFGACCEAEAYLAEAVVDRVPHIEKIRFTSSGTEATMTAIRLARAVTNRRYILKFNGCYHGHHDGMLVKAGSGALTFGQPNSPGVPDAVAALTLTAEYNDIDGVRALFEQHGQDIAGIIIEPLAANMNFVAPQSDFLIQLRSLCHQYRSLLIFDEVITGFRLHHGGAQAYYQVQADLITFGKIIGGGLPVGAIAGQAALMDQLSPTGPVYHAGTLSGNPVAMAAGLTTLDLLTPADYDTLNKKTVYLAQNMARCAQSHQIPLQVPHACGVLGLQFGLMQPAQNYDDIARANASQYIQFFNGMLDKGHYFAPSAFEVTFLSLAHSTADLDATLSAFDDTLKEMHA